MELTNKINIIWYGRGNLNSGECEDFNLELMVDGDGPSKYIEYVYEVVSEATGASAWRTWSSAIFEEGSTAQDGLNKLTCGHLYVIVLRDDGAGTISKLDIPEAIAVDGGDAGLKQLDGNDLQIIPNNVTEGDPDPDPDPEPEPEVCLDNTWKIYTYVSEDGEKKIVNSDTVYSVDGAVLPLDGNAWRLGVKEATDLISDGATSSDDLELRLGTDVLVTINQVKIAEVAEGEVIPVRVELLEVGNEALSSMVGCYHGNAVAGDGQPFVLLEKILEDSNDGGEGDGGEGDGGEGDGGTPDDNSGGDDEVQTFEECVAFLDEELDSYRLTYTKPTEGDASATNFEFIQKDGSNSVVDISGEDTKSKEFTDLVSGILASDGLKLDVNFALYFTASFDGDLTARAVDFAIVYPNTEGTQTLSCGANCQASSASITGLKIYDPTREAGECVSLTAEEMGGVQVFQGSEI
jgi:hypothetical protein